jgi:hypothetical protein
MSVDNETYSMLHLASDVNITGDDADDGLLLPAVQDDGLFLPAVRIDDGEALFRTEPATPCFSAKDTGRPAPLAEFPSLAAIWMEPQTPSATP